MNAPFPRRVLRSYQEKATTYLLIAYEFIEVPALGGPRGVECGDVARVPSRIGRAMASISSTAGRGWRGCRRAGRQS